MKIANTETTQERVLVENCPDASIVLYDKRYFFVVPKCERSRLATGIVAFAIADYPVQGGVLANGAVVTPCPEATLHVALQPM